MNLSILKKKKVYIPLIAVALVGFLVYRSYAKNHQPPQYETVAVARGDLEQTVDATGKIESVNDLSLRFEVPGTLSEVKVKEGDSVKAGALLANLRLAELNAAVWQASANLQQKLAGATDQDRIYYKAAMESAEAAWKQSQIDADNSVKTAESAVETARNNLQLAEGGENSQLVVQAYSDAVATLHATLSKLDDALTQADNILGIDNKFANDSFESYLGTLDPTKLPAAQNAYTIARVDRDAARLVIVPLTTASSHSAVDTVFPITLKAIDSANQVLTKVNELLSATQPLDTLTQSSLDTKKSTIITTRAAITSQYTAVINQQQAIADAKNSYTKYTIAYEKALRDLDQTKANAASSVTIKEAAYKQAAANYQSKINPPREVDVAYYRAAVAQAVANRDKAVIRAPIDGVVTKINKKSGELVTSADVVVQLLTPHYEVKVDIPETDVSKLKLNNPVDITLDAFGQDVQFSGTIIAIDPASTEVQDVVYYRVTLTLADTDKAVKPGMTANVSVKTDARSGVLFVPLRAVRTRDDGSKYVRVLENNQEKEVTIKLGLKANENKVEVLEGLNEGQQVIVSAKNS